MRTIWVLALVLAGCGGDVALRRTRMSQVVDSAAKVFGRCGMFSMYRQLS